MLSDPKTTTNTNSTGRDTSKIGGFRVPAIYLKLMNGRRCLLVESLTKSGIQLRRFEHFLNSPNNTFFIDFSRAGEMWPGGWI